MLPFPKSVAFLPYLSACVYSVLPEHALSGIRGRRRGLHAAGGVCSPSGWSPCAAIGKCHPCDFLQKANNLVLNVDGCIGALFLDLLASSGAFTKREADQIVEIG